jgi:hypothetical protein
MRGRGPSAACTRPSRWHRWTLLLALPSGEKKKKILASSGTEQNAARFAGGCQNAMLLCELEANEGLFFNL